MWQELGSRKSVEGEEMKRWIIRLVILGVVILLVRNFLEADESALDVETESYAPADDTSAGDAATEAAVPAQGSA